MDIPPITYTGYSYNFTMTSPKGHVPPSQRSRAPKKPALADKHLIVKERLKLLQAGACEKKQILPLITMPPPITTLSPYLHFKLAQERMWLRLMLYCLNINAMKYR